MDYIIAVMPLICGFVLDLILGDPYNLPHPVRLMGKCISALEGFFRRIMPNSLRTGGTYLALIMITLSGLIPMIILWACYSANLWLGAIVETVLVYYMLAARCLSDECMKVYRAAEEHDLDKARRAVSMIVGRDVDKLDEKGVLKAAVETAAENTSDGECAPLFYMGIGGAVFGFIYKAANTMDSMIGYKNEKYIEFGRFAAKLDDVMNYIPSRLSALMMILAAYILKLDGKAAYRIWKRDRDSQPSPNSAQTESAAAGALGLELLGDAYYFGKLHHKNTIGDSTREIEPNDIRRMNRLMYMTSVLMLILAVAVRIFIASLLN
ncbi:MAG: adenosylcobinamide-phosphate synthase CbiB [Oscillospiraceae bacterium]|nr:adenosylcobinamide-phosphate synthase CbiB [Oscillospiraceae bacterium]